MFKKNDSIENSDTSSSPNPIDRRKILTTGAIVGGVGALAALFQNAAPATPTSTSTSTSSDLTASSSNCIYLPAPSGNGDDSRIFNSAILTLKKSPLNDGTIIAYPGATYSIQNPIYITEGLIIDLNNSTLVGTGSNGNAIFESAWISNGNLVSNINAGNEVGRVVSTTIKNGFIKNCKYGFNLKNFNENSLIDNIQFTNCTFSVYSVRPFYSSYSRLFTREPSSTERSHFKTPAYFFSQFVNVVHLESLFVVNRNLGFSFTGGCYALTINNCGVEQSNNGFNFEGTIHSASINGNYFEDISQSAFYFNPTYSQFYGIEIQSNWFNLVKTAIIANNFYGTWKASNKLNSKRSDCDQNALIDFSSPYNFATIEMYPIALATNTNLTLPANYLIGKKCILQTNALYYDSSSGDNLIHTAFNGNSKISFSLLGDSGDPAQNQVPFCTVTKSNSNGSANIIIDTQIKFRNFSLFLVYNFVITESNTITKIYGQVFGNNIVKADTSNKNISLKTNSNGNVQLIISNVNNTNNSAAITGVIRHA